MTLQESLNNLERKRNYADDAVLKAEKAEAEVGESIRTHRISKNISLRKLAQLSGISPSFLSDIELGNRFPAHETLERIIKSLKTIK